MKTFHSASFPALNFDRVALAWGARLLALALVTHEVLGQTGVSFLLQPKDYSVSMGANVTNTVSTSGAVGAVTYQWWGNDAPLVGATSAKLSFPNVQPAQAGTYFAVATDSTRSVTSRVAKLEVDATFTKITTGVLAIDRNCTAEVSAADYDGDGDLDLFITGFDPGRNALYRNEGGFEFTRMTDTNAFPFLAIRNSFPAAWGDYDNDGRPDLALLGGTDNLLVSRNNGFFHNNGDGTLSRGPRIEAVSAWSMGWGDYDSDGFLDLLISSWKPGAPPTLLRNNGRGGFVKMTADDVGDLATAWISEQSGGMAWADYDDDGWLDVAIAGTDRSRLPLFRNTGTGPFQFAAESGIDASPGPITVAWGDYDNDGLLDLLTAVFRADRPAQLYHNLGSGVFTNVTAGSLPKFKNVPANSAAWGDYDNDGYLDAYLTWVNELLHNNGDGTFTRITSGSLVNDTLPSPSGSISAQWFDSDNDGFLDLFVANGSDYGAGGLVPGFFYRNNGNANHWLKIRPVGTASNRMGAGAKVRVKTVLNGREMWQRRDITAGSIYNGNQPIAHFGLGSATNVAILRVEWPSGNVQELTDLAANQVLTITEQVLITPPRPVATINGSVSLNQTVTASSRQWYFEGVALAAQTNRMLVLTNLQPAQAGRYTAVAQTANGPATNSVNLQVNPQFTKILTGEIVTEKYGTDAVTWFDYDRDGFLDVLVPHDQKSDADSLFRNNGDGTFTKVLGSPLTPHELASLSGAVADYDNDGDVDVLLARFDKPNADLFRNDGSAGFSRVADTPFVRALGQGMDAGWADYDGDGDVDLLVVNGYDRSQNDVLYRNNGDGTFSAVSAEEAGDLVSDRSVTWLCTWVDFDGDGHPDVATLGSGLRLYRNTGTGRFTRVRLGSLSSMSNDWGLAWGDYDNDGFPDLFAGRFGQGNAGLHRNVGGTTFTSISRAGDLMTFGHACLGVWGDYDNDGYLDLFVEGYTEKSALYRNRGDGTFESVDLGNLLSDGDQRDTAVWVDYDNNGFLDLMLACGDVAGFEGYPGQQNQLFRNNGNGNHWLKVRTIGTTSNRDGIGAKVRVLATVGGRTFTQLREISGNSGYHGVPLLAHFGLGNATHATTVHVDWPSGITQEVPMVAADQMLTVVEPAMWTLSAHMEAGGLRLQCRGAALASADIQWSANLKTWTWVADLKTDATGAAAVTIPILEANPLRFYRIRTP